MRTVAPANAAAISAGSRSPSPSASIHARPPIVACGAVLEPDSDAELEPDSDAELEPDTEAEPACDADCAAEPDADADADWDADADADEGMSEPNELDAELYAEL
jgi:hypothetical protein